MGGRGHWVGWYGRPPRFSLNLSPTFKGNLAHYIPDSKSDVICCIQQEMMRIIQSETGRIGQIAKRRPVNWSMDITTANTGVTSKFCNKDLLKEINCSTRLAQCAATGLNNQEANQAFWVWVPLLGIDHRRISLRKIWASTCLKVNSTFHPSGVDKSSTSNGVMAVTSPLSGDR